MWALKEKSRSFLLRGKRWKETYKCVTFLSIIFFLLSFHYLFSIIFPLSFFYYLSIIFFLSKTCFERVYQGLFLSAIYSHWCVVDCKFIRALAKILAIFIWFDCHFFLNHLMLIMSSIKPEDHHLTNIYFIKLY